jgi:hypothetical protein
VLPPGVVQVRVGMGLRFVGLTGPAFSRYNGRMRFFAFVVIALSLGGCLGCFRREVVYVQSPCVHETREPKPAERVVFVERPPEREVVYVEKTRSLVGHVVVGATLLLADCVGLVLPVDQERIETLRTKMREGGY